MPNPLAPRQQHVMSPLWAFYVNELAASPLVSLRARAAIYRRCGLEVDAQRIYPGCYFHTANVRIGPRALINHGCHIENSARVEIGADTALGALTVVLTSDHDLGPHEARAGRWVRKPVSIGAGCWIGARSLILAGVTIGDGCVIAAGSVVREDCEPDGMYAGVPARRVKDLDAGA